MRFNIRDLKQDGGTAPVARNSRMARTGLKDSNYESMIFPGGGRNEMNMTMKGMNDDVMYYGFDDDGRITDSGIAKANGGDFTVKGQNVYEKRIKAQLGLRTPGSGPTTPTIPTDSVLDWSVIYPGVTDDPETRANFDRWFNHVQQNPNFNPDNLATEDLEAYNQYLATYDDVVRYNNEAGYSGFTEAITEELAANASAPRQPVKIEGMLPKGTTVTPDPPVPPAVNPYSKYTTGTAEEANAYVGGFERNAPLPGELDDDNGNILSQYFPNYGEMFGPPTAQEIAQQQVEAAHARPFFNGVDPSTGNLANIATSANIAGAKAAGDLLAGNTPTSGKKKAATKAAKANATTNTTPGANNDNSANAKQSVVDQLLEAQELNDGLASGFSNPRDIAFIKDQWVEINSVADDLFTGKQTPSNSNQTTAEKQAALNEQVTKQHPSVQGTADVTTDPTGGRLAQERARRKAAIQQKKNESAAEKLNRRIERATTSADRAEHAANINAAQEANRTADVTTRQGNRRARMDLAELDRIDRLANLPRVKSRGTSQVAPNQTAPISSGAANNFPIDPNSIEDNEIDLLPSPFYESLTPNREFGGYSRRQYQIGGDTGDEEMDLSQGLFSQNDFRGQPMSSIGYGEDISSFLQSNPLTQTPTNSSNNTSGFSGNGSPVTAPGDAIAPLNVKGYFPEDIYNADLYDEQVALVDAPEFKSKRRRHSKPDNTGRNTGRGGDGFLGNLGSLTDDAWLQLAGEFTPAIYNLAESFKPPAYTSAKYNPELAKVLHRQRSRRSNLDKRPLHAGYTAATRGIQNQVGNAQAQNALRANLYSTMSDKSRDLAMREQAIDIQLAEAADKTQVARGEDRRRAEESARSENRAAELARDSLRNKAVTQFGTGIVDTGRQLGNARQNQFEWQVMQNIYKNYGPAAYQAVMSGQVDPNELIQFKGK